MSQLLYMNGLNGRDIGLSGGRDNHFQGRGVTGVHGSQIPDRAGLV